MSQAIDNFWQELIKIGKQVLDQGTESGYGMTLMEIKFEQGVPRIIIHSHQQSKKFTGNTETKEWLNELVDNMGQVRYDGTRTFTVTFTGGRIGRVLTDDYENHIL